MSLPGGGGKPCGGAAAGRLVPRAGCLERECSKVIILAGQPATVAAVRQLGSQAPLTAY